MKIGKGIAGYVAATGEPVDVGDAYRDDRFNRRVDIVTGYRTRQVICVPVKSQPGRVVAVLQCINKLGPHDATFTFDDRTRLEEFAFQISAVRSLRLHCTHTHTLHRTHCTHCTLPTHAPHALFHQVLDAKGKEVEEVAHDLRVTEFGDRRVFKGTTRSTSIFANLVDLLASDAILAGAETATVARQHRHALNAVSALCAEGDKNRDAIVRAGGVAPVAELLTPLPWRDDETIVAALRAFASLTRSPLANEELNGAGGWRALLPIAAKAVTPSFFSSSSANAKSSRDVRERATHALRALANVANNASIATSLLLDLGALELALAPLARPPPLKKKVEKGGSDPLSVTAAATQPQPPSAHSIVVGFYLNPAQMERGTDGIEEAAAEAWIADLQAQAARLLGCLARAAIVAGGGSGGGSGGGGGNTPGLARAAALKLSAPRVAETFINHCAALSGANLRRLGQQEELGTYHTNENVPVCAVALADLVEALPYFRLQACSIDGVTVIRSFYRYTGVSRPRVREQLMRLIAAAMLERPNQRMLLGQLRSHDPEDLEFMAMSTHEQRRVIQVQRDQFVMGRDLQRIVAVLIRSQPRPAALATHHARMLEFLTREPLNHQYLIDGGLAAQMVDVARTETLGEARTPALRGLAVLASSPSLEDAGADLLRLHIIPCLARVVATCRKEAPLIALCRLVAAIARAHPEMRVALARARFLPNGDLFDELKGIAAANRQNEGAGGAGGVVTAQERDAARDAGATPFLAGLGMLLEPVWSPQLQVAACKAVEEFVRGGLKIEVCQARLVQSLIGVTQGGCQEPTRAAAVVLQLLALESGPGARGARMGAAALGGGSAPSHRRSSARRRWSEKVHTLSLPD